MTTATERKGAAPIVPRSFWLSIPFLWILFAVIMSAPGGRLIEDDRVTEIPWQTLFYDGLVNMGWWALLAPFIILTTWRIRETRESIRGELAVAAMVFFLIVYFLLRSRVDIPGVGFRIAPGREGFFSILPQSFMIYQFIAISARLVHSQARTLERERQIAEQAVHASRLESQLADARLEVLRGQLQPHFLFNTLNAVSALIDDDPAQARRMLTRLSELLRMALDAMRDPEITLAREVEWLEHYVELQRVRFESRLDLEIDVEPGTLGARIPPLLLQPLVENAIEHAIEPRPAGGSIRVEASRMDGRLRLAVVDDGPGPSSQEAHGIGLRVTRDRLAAMYGADASVSLRTRDDRAGAVALIELPFRSAHAEAEGPAPDAE